LACSDYEGHHIGQEGIGGEGMEIGWAGDGSGVSDTGKSIIIGLMEGVEELPQVDGVGVCYC